MSGRNKRSFIYPVNQLTNSSIIQLWFRRLSHPENPYKIANIVIPVFIGLMLGSILLVIVVSNSQWAILPLLTVPVLAIAILVNNLRKLLLVALVVDIPLGLDVSLGNRLEHNGGPSGFMISLMTLALLVGYLVWLAQKPDRERPSFLFHVDISIPALLYMIAMLGSALQSTELWFSITQMFLELQFLLMYFFLANHVKTWNDINLIFTSMAICLLVESLIILSQYFLSFEVFFLGIQIGGLGSSIASTSARLGGTLGHPNAAATFLTAALVLTVGGFFTQNRLVNKKLAFLACSLGIVALITTQSRAAWIIFAISMLILTLFALKKHINTKAIWLICLAALVVGYGFSRQIIERFTADDGGSALSRLWQAKLSLNILENHALTGIGLNNLWEVEAGYLPAEMIGNQNVIHDKYLTVWVETGIFGIISFLWLFVAAILRALQALKRIKDTYFAMAVASLLAALMVFVLHMSVATFNERSRLQFIWLVLALIAAATEITKRTDWRDDTLVPLKHPEQEH